MNKPKKVILQAPLPSKPVLYVLALYGKKGEEEGGGRSMKLPLRAVCIPK